MVDYSKFELNEMAFTTRKANTEVATKIEIELDPDKIKAALEENLECGPATILIPQSDLATLLAGSHFNELITVHQTPASISMGCVGRLFGIEIEVDALKHEDSYLPNAYLVYYDHNREPIHIGPDETVEEIATEE